MRVILKIIIVITSISTVVPFFDRGFTYCGILSLLLFFIVFFDLLKSLMSLVNCEYTIDTPMNESNMISDWDVDFLNYNTVPTDHQRYMPQNNTMYCGNTSSVISTISMTMDDLVDNANKRINQHKKFEVKSKIDAEKKEKSMFNTLKSIFIKKEEPKETKQPIVKTEKVVDKKDEKKSATKAYIILKNEKGVTKEKSDVYQEIINLLKSKKYATSKICRMLQALQYINVMTKNVVIYTNERQLDESDIIPKKEIITHIGEKLGLKVTFINMKTVSIFDYYTKVDAL